MKVLKAKPVPKGIVECQSCGSELEYTNADLCPDFEQPIYGIYANGMLHKNYHICCPVCGCNTPASWITIKGGRNEND